MQKQRSLLVFEESIQSPNTLKLYMHNLGKFMKYYTIKDYDGLLAIPDDKLQVMLEDYLFYLKRNDWTTSCHWWKMKKECKKTHIQTGPLILLTPQTKIFTQIGRRHEKIVSFFNYFL